MVIQDPLTLLGPTDQVTLSKIALVTWRQFEEFQDSRQFEGQMKIYQK